MNIIIIITIIHIAAYVKQIVNAIIIVSNTITITAAIITIVLPKD